MKKITPHQAIEQVFRTLYNVSPLDIFEAVYGKGHHESYVMEKTDAIRTSPASWYGSLDTEHTKRFCDFVINRWKHQDD